MLLMREEIWTEKIFKDDAGYFLRITKFRLSCKVTDSLHIFKTGRTVKDYGT